MSTIAPARRSKLTEFSLCRDRLAPVVRAVATTDLVNVISSRLTLADEPQIHRHVAAVLTFLRHRVPLGCAEVGTLQRA
jgi:hypothetical protein